MARRTDIALIVARAIRRTGSPACNGGQSLPEREIKHAQRIVEHIADELARELTGFERARFMCAAGFPLSDAGKAVL